MKISELAKQLNLDTISLQHVEDYFNHTLHKYVEFGTKDVVLDDNFNVDEIELILEVLKLNNSFTEK